MRKKTNKQTLEEEILLCKKKLKRLAPFIETDEEKSKEYNKIIVQKAILVNNYKKLCYKPSLKQRFVEIFKTNKKEKLICDYFLT